MARVLRKQLGTTASLAEYTFVDFCAGAGGPTPAIEREMNRGREGGVWRKDDSKSDSDEEEEEEEGTTHNGVDFILTDLHPHLSAWHTAAKQSPHILFVPESIDASAVPGNLSSLAVRRRRKHLSPPSSPPPPPPPFSSPPPLQSPPQKKQFRLFSLALHHFPDAQASLILHHALRTSSGFGIFELQARTLEHMILMMFFGPLMWMGGWWWFWGQWDLLFWMYIVPVVPFVVVFDGLVSGLRTRTEGEIMELLVRGRGRGGGDGEDGDGDGDEIDGEKWRFESGVEKHTWLLGEMNWFIAIKEPEI